jgi:2-aminoethylphosphonate-pyruvate transaminase
LLERQPTQESLVSTTRPLVSVPTPAIVLCQRLVFESDHQVPGAAVALVRRTLVGLARVGVREAIVVDGEQADAFRDALALHELPSLRVRVLANRSWRRASGSALRLAAPWFDQPCLVVRGDRPLDDEALAALASADLGEHDAVIVVAASPSPDLASEPRVKLRTRRKLAEVVGIGLDLDDHDALFTGHALVAPAILAELEGIPNPALEDGLAALARRGRVRAQPGRAAWLWSCPQPTEVRAEVEALLDRKAHPRYTLLNPGPVNTTARVKSALVHYDVCHRDSNFSELMVSLTGKLRRIFRASPYHTITVLTGSGTAAMECALSSTVPRDGKILIIDNGAFGERLVEICELHGMNVVHLRYAWGDRVNLADVEAALSANPDIAVVAMIHHETSVGLLNPVRQVGALCKRHGALLIVDAVSSLGAEDIDVVRDQIDICYASANKCLHGLSGAGFLCVAPEVWRRIEHIRPRSYYLDLKRYRKYVEDLAQTPFTPAVSTYFALDAGCAEFLADGHAARFAMYRAKNQRLRGGLAALGMAPFTRTGDESNSIVTCCVPDGVTFQELYDALKSRSFIVYGCKDVLADRFLQVANMGDLDEATIERFLVAMAEAIAEVRGRTARTVGPGVSGRRAEPKRSAGQNAS